jgi:uncharacterized protein (DUF885 family)
MLAEDRHTHLARENSNMRRNTLFLALQLAFGFDRLAAQRPGPAVEQARIAQDYARLLKNHRGLADKARLHRLLATYWRGTMVEFPEFATYVGYPGQNHRWTDQSPEAIARRLRELKRPLAVLQSIKRGRLTPADRLNYDLFLRSVNEQIEGGRFHDEYLSVTQLGGPQQDIPQVIATQPARTVHDYEDIIDRIEGIDSVIGQTIVLLDKGLEQSITQPKTPLRDVPDQVKGLIVDDPLKCPLLEPFTRMPDDIPAAEQERLRRLAAAAYTASARPAYQRLLTYLTDRYLPNARESVGLDALPNGAAWYAYRSRVSTTTNLSPAEIHKIGLTEVRRIRAGMDSIIAGVGFSGDFQEFARFLRTDSGFFFTDSASLIRAYREIAKRIDPELAKLFGKLPRLPYGVIAVPSFMAKSQTTAYYLGGSVEAGRPGYFYANTYDLKTRPKWEMEALTLHEAVPGHHLQLSLSQEEENLPEFRRFGGYTAFIEGWGLYAESLGSELGMYQDPYSRFGQLTYEMWRAVRLVVDTGLHSMGWSRQQAIDFFAANAPKATHDIEVEVDRYIVWPGQALAYKIGELKLKELRSFAKAQLGPKFDVRAFHDAVLANGALPLDLLERHIHEWVAAQKAVLSS